MEKKGVGIVGFGFIGRIHALALSVLPYAFHELPFLPEIRGICTSRPETAQKVQQETGIWATDSLDMLLNNKEIEMVVVALPNAGHRVVVEKAARAGKAIYCDKPLALNLEEALAMEKVVKEARIPFGMAFQNRFVPAIQKARELIDEGKIGRVFRTRFSYLHSGYVDPARPLSWRLKKDLSGGGSLWDLGSHLVDLVRFLLGEPEIVSARGRTFITERPIAPGAKEKEPIEVDDWSLVHFTLPEETEGTLETSRFATGSCDEIRIEIEGSKGALRYNSMQPNFLEFYDLTDSGAPIGGRRGFKQIETVAQFPHPYALPGKFAFGWTNAHVACIHDFILRWSGQKAQGATIEDGVKVQAFLEEAYQLMGWK
ncbi:MAG: Gfo/Idh/MocA family oxidoreductase [Atribacterota bacterium]